MMKKYLMIMVALGLISAPFAYADFTKTNWRYVRPIHSITELPLGGYMSVIINKEIRDKAKVDLSDLRVVSRQKEEIPYQVVSNDFNTPSAQAIIFFGVAGTEYSLYYGNTDALPPDYTFARYFQFAENETLPQVTLGDEVRILPHVSSLNANVSNSEAQPKVLTAALVLLSALVTFLLISQLKHIKYRKRGPKEKRK